MARLDIATIILLLGSANVFGQPTVVDDIRSVLDAQVYAWNHGDINGFMEGYWKSDSLLFTSGGNVARGWKTTLEKYRRTYSDREKMGTLRFSDLQISVLSESSAWVFGRWGLARNNDHPGGVFTLVMKQFPEGWRIVHDHTTTENEKGKMKKEE